MESFRKIIAGFKSIFISDDILKENEEHANIVMANTMINVFLLAIPVAILAFLGILNARLKMMTYMMIASFFLLVIPAMICHINKGKGSWLKYILFTCFTIVIACLDAVLKYNVTLAMVLPIILSARYYNKKFTLEIFYFTIILFIISTFISMCF